MPPIPRYVNIGQIAQWLGRTGVWARFIRAGRYRVPRPFPSPDGELYLGERVIPLWRIQRRAEIEAWYQDYLAMDGKQPDRRTEKQE